MKALSVRAPWWWAILHGKPVENRDWHTNFRGVVLLHASKDLACWCPLDQPCHADVLLEIANRVTEEATQ